MGADKMFMRDPETQPNTRYYYDVTNTAFDGNETFIGRTKGNKVHLLEPIEQYIELRGIPVGAEDPVQPAKGKARRRLSPGEEILRHHRIANHHKDSPVLLKLLQHRLRKPKRSSYWPN